MAKSERPAQLILIRHPESARNAAKKGNRYFTNDEDRRPVKGIPDHKITITPTGEIQIRKAGIYLREQFGIPDFCYHSGYVRTEKALGILLEAFSVAERNNIRVRRNLFIRERDPGWAYDMTTEEAEAAFPWLKAYWESFGGFFGVPPGGESLAKVCERTYKFLNMLFRDRAGKKIWVVTHGLTIRTFRFLLEQKDYDWSAQPTDPSPKNCGITVYNLDEEAQRLVLERYNDTNWESIVLPGEII